MHDTRLREKKVWGMGIESVIAGVKSSAHDVGAASSTEDKRVRRMGMMGMVNQQEWKRATRKKKSA
jgi:hypothetical protein